MTESAPSGWKEWVTGDLVTSTLNVSTFLGILYVCFLALPNSTNATIQGISTPTIWNYVSICAIIMISRMLISIVSSKNRIDIIGPMLLSSIFIGPLIAIAGYIISSDASLKELMKSVGTTMLGVGVGASANFKPRRSDPDA